MFSHIKGIVETRASEVLQVVSCLLLADLKDGLPGGKIKKRWKFSPGFRS